MKNEKGNAMKYARGGMTSLDYLMEIQRLENELKKREWISVKDRLPDEEQKVLCFTCDGEIVVADFSHFSYDFGELGEWHYFGIRDPRFVTHWMPLPEPPKEE